MIGRGVDELKIAQTIMFRNQGENSEEDIIQTVEAIKEFVALCVSGKFKGRTAEGVNMLNGSLEQDKLFSQGDRAQVVVSYNAVRRQELVEVKRQLEQTGCPILGTVLNRVELDNYLNRKYYYKSYYKSYYAHDDDSAPNRRSIPREKDGAGKRK